MTKRVLKKLNLCVACIFFISLFSVGYFISKKSWSGSYFIYLDNNYSSSNVRNIASIGRQMNISSSLFKGSKLSKPKALLHSARTEDQGDVIAVYLGHLLLKSRNGASVLACQQYQVLEITFIAPEVSFHAHTPKMVLKSDCKFSKEKLDQIGPIIIPKSKILRAPVDQQLFTSQDVTLLFSHVSIKWPKVWILNEVRFIDKKDNKKEIKVSFTSNRKEDFLTFKLR